MATRLFPILLLTTLLAATAFAWGVSPGPIVHHSSVLVGGLTDGQVYTISPPYKEWDPLFSFVKNGDQFHFYSNCSYISGCDYYGLWKNPFVMVHSSPDTYDLFYSQSTVQTHYQIKVLPTGNAKVFVSNDQCYPSGCQNPPLHLIGTYKAN